MRVTASAPVIWRTRALLRHPIKDGKPSAKVLSSFGQPGSPGIENQYCAARAKLPPAWSDRLAQPLIDAAAKKAPLEDTARLDLTSLPFVSIDAARTVDIDDALHAEVTANGWQLSVAVADPTAYPRGLADVTALVAQRGSSVYFHGEVIPMLPEGISQGLCALAEDTPRPALVCQMQITEDGAISPSNFTKR